MKRIIIPFILLLAGFMSCAPQLYRFSSNEPVLYFNDIHPIPLPENVYHDRFDYYANVIPPRPTVSNLLIAKNDRARDVNCMDQVPASSWFIPRLGTDDISPQQLVDGPIEYGPPEPPLEILKVRNPEGNPRLFVRDSRKNYFLLKMDPHGFYGITTSTSLIVNRLFWGFGYNVPEDHLFYFQKNDLVPGPETGYNDDFIATILQRVATPVNGKYRAIASRIIDGLPLGPSPAKGVRHNDPNDKLPHEERRVLRALRVFAAFVNMYDIGSDNLFDIYVGEPGQGYIKHYFIDFDDAFGTNVVRNDRTWAGFNHIFNMSDILRNMVTLGFQVRDWERLQPTPWQSVGIFEAEYFKPGDWKETHPFDPIQHSQLSDNYWAAKILAQVTDAHLAALVKAAQYPTENAGQYVLHTLIQRRDKVLRYYLNQISPIEWINLQDMQLTFNDIEQNIFPSNGSQYQVCVVNDRDQRITKEWMTEEMRISLKPDWLHKAENYICVKICKVKEEKTEPVQIHITLNKSGQPIVAGIVH